MALFRRARRSAGTPEATSGDADSVEVAGAEVAADEEAGSEVAGLGVAEDELADIDGIGATMGDAAGQARPEESQPPTDPGPYDRSQVSGLQDRIDLGSLWLTPVDGMQLRLEIDQESNEVTSTSVLIGESMVQIQAFAAPRSSGIWEEIRSEIAESVAGQGGTTTEQPGPWGRELHARLPGQTADGRVTFHPARFIGVDGPRWFLRAVITGPAAADGPAAEPLLDLVRSCVVLRGDQAMAPRELLPLQVPMQLQDEAAEPEPPPRADELSPFHRGPEITEIR